MKEKYERTVMNSFLKKEISLEHKDFLMIMSSKSVWEELNATQDYEEFLRLMIVSFKTDLPSVQRLDKEKLEIINYVRNHYAVPEK